MSDRHLHWKQVLATGVVACLMATALPAQAGNVSRWAIDDGDWNVGGNWTDGVPGPSTIAEIGNDGTVDLLNPGNTCGELRVGVNAETGSVTIAGLGTLTVTGDATIGHSFAGGLALVGGAFDIGGDLRVTAFGALALGGSTSIGLSVDGAIILEGAIVLFGAIGLPGHVFDGSSLTMTSGTRFDVTVFPNGTSPIIVTGPGVLGGELTVGDDSLAPADGEFEIVRATSLSGTFSKFTAPSPEWSWRMTEQSVYLVRDGGMPVADESWSGIKGEFTE